MANPLAEETFEVDGKTYTFALRNMAMVALERKVHQPFYKFLARGNGEYGADEILLLFHAGLVRYHRDMTEEDASDLVDRLTFPVVTEMVGRGIQQFFGGAAATGKARPRKQAPKIGTGTTSSASGPVN